MAPSESPLTQTRCAAGETGPLERPVSQQHGLPEKLQAAPLLKSLYVFRLQPVLCAGMPRSFDKRHGLNSLLIEDDALERRNGVCRLQLAGGSEEDLGGHSSLNIETPRPTGILRTFLETDLY